MVSCSTYSFKSFIQLSDYTGCAVCVRFTKRIRLIYSGIKTTLVVLLRLIYEIELTLFENYTTQVVLHVLGLQKINRVIRVIHLKIGLHWLCCMCLNHQEVQRHFFWESYYTGCTVCVWFTNIKKLIFSEIRLNWLCCMCLVYKKKKKEKKKLVIEEYTVSHSRLWWWSALKRAKPVSTGLQPCFCPFCVAFRSVYKCLCCLVVQGMYCWVLMVKIWPIWATARQWALWSPALRPAPSSWRH